MKNEKTLTYQTRLVVTEEQEDILDECALLLNVVERSLYAEVAKGQSSASCKNDFLKKFNITARQFNACRVSLEGKIEACKVGQEHALSTLKQQIEELDRKIKLLEKKSSKRFILHQKKRRRDILLHRLTSIETKKKQKHVNLCFGGKKLFHSQFYLKKNGLNSHIE